MRSLLTSFIQCVLVWTLLGCSHNSGSPAATRPAAPAEPEGARSLNRVSSATTVGMPTSGGWSWKENGWSMDWWDDEPYAPSKNFTGIAGICFLPSEVNADGPIYVDNYVVLVHSPTTHKLVVRGHSTSHPKTYTLA
jgi:hypothetical protein